MNNKYAKVGVYLLTGFCCFLAGVLFVYLTFGLADSITSAAITPCVCD